MDPVVVSESAHAAATSLSQWSLSEILEFTVLGGAFGGAADLLARIRLKGGQFQLVDESISGTQFCIELLIQLVIGMCGAAAIIFVFASTTWFPREDTTQTELWLLTMSVVAGFGSRRFLPMVTKRLERQVQELEEKVEKEHKELRETERRSLIRDAVSRALALVGRDAVATTTQLNASLVELRELLRKHPKERAATIVTGRILRKLDELSEAISVHTAFVYAKTKARETDLDYADVLYNRSCYRCLLWSANQDPALKRDGLKDLAESVRYYPQNGPDAAADDDFRRWWQDEEFKQITKTPA